MFQYTVFSAITGVVCALCLIVGAIQANVYLLVIMSLKLPINMTEYIINGLQVTWLLVTAVASVKHVHVVITNDWTSQEVCVN